MIREGEFSKWKVAFLYIQLRGDPTYVIKGINSTHLKLIHEKDIKYLVDLLNVISSKDSIELAGETASLELLIGEMLFDYHERSNASDLYDIDCFCYELIKGGKQPENYELMIKQLESILIDNDPPYESLKDACKAILGIDFGTAACRNLVQQIRIST